MYCTVDNIKDLVPQNLLEELTSGSDAIIEKAIAGANATVEAYLTGAYDLPQQSVFLQTIAEKITVYNLYLMSAFDETPQIVITSYLEALSALEKIQNGTLSLVASDNTANDRQSEVFTNKTADDRLFGKIDLSGF